MAIRLQHGTTTGGGTRNNKQGSPFLLWWSGTTVIFMFVLVLRTHLKVVSRFQEPNNTRTIFPSGDPAAEDSFLYESKNNSILAQLSSRDNSRISRRRSSATSLEATNRLRPVGRFSNTWNFTTQEHQVVAPMASAFASSWDELHGKKCQQTTYDNLPALQDYISSLDLYIVSHGGLGSNALIDHLDDHTSLKVKVKNEHDTIDDTSAALYHSSCHLGNPAFVALVRRLTQQQQASSKRRIPPTLVIVGDFWNAFQSMKRRTWLNMNIAKNLYGSQACRSKWENSLPIFPKDPAGIKMMMLVHIIAAQQQQQQEGVVAPESPIVFLQASYTRESILDALQLLLLPTTSNSPGLTQVEASSKRSASSIERHLEGFQVRERGTQYKTVAAAKQDAAAASSSSSGVDPLLELYQPYEALEDILTRMPRAWKAAETPRELLDYLLKEFQ